MVYLRYSQILVCRFAYLLRFICNPKLILIAFSWSFMGMHTYRVTKNLSHSTCVSSRSGRSGSTSCFSSHTVSRYSFLWSISYNIFHIFWSILLFKMAPGILLKCYLVFLHAGRLWCTLQRKYVCYRSFVQE